MGPWRGHAHLLWLVLVVMVVILVLEYVVSTEIKQE